ncbi:MAG: glycosyltransferase family 2 protein, partial [Erysipelotrichaceae bacterium]
MKLSIVVPIYNVENYLDQCLSSIQDQTFNDFQVILINDGSTDASLNIAQSYCEKDSRFKVYTKENGGLSSARNYGLKYVLGEYLTFLDSDDYVDTEAYSLMMNKIEKESLDIVMSDIKYFFEDQSQCYVLKGMNQSIEASTSKRAL